MARSRDTRSRGDIEGTVEKHDQDMDRKEQEATEYADDVNVVGDTFRELERGGTSEGEQAVDAALQEADTAAVGGFEREGEALDGIQDESEEHEDELDDRGETTESDLRSIDDADAHLQTFEPVSGLRSAADSAREDINYLEDQSQREEQRRKQSDDLQQQLQERVNDPKDLT